MGPLTTVLRLPLYVTLWVFAALLFIFTAVRLNYTLHLPKGDPLNGGSDFFDPIVAHLLVCSMLALGSIPFVMHWVPQLITSAASANLFELAALSVIWLLWLVGCVVSTSIWPNLSFCYQFAPCRILSAMMAFAWLGWIVLVVLIVLAVLNAVQKARPARSPLVVEWAATNSFNARSEYARSEYGGSSVHSSNMREVV
ncbi:uncharacterized protein TRAVEDRAFT_164255 [Trametes versicolor FP-101664 SS1]|uniref:uncharacterized protein n=1 Tax=Trametes versicolor (strain FP-101664) TaxID=717944 RepID=UPI0004622471|nr:uncharacterized protein TRAVEDRAFT_164255 [Trametes versicolor FP-101664 SS1]EIW62346.1 hypothetical protein TRAVEDRAFT_164255 [Trametes versicolor FP-101664 SS1]